MWQELPRTLQTTWSARLTLKEYEAWIGSEKNSQVSSMIKPGFPLNCLVVEKQYAWGWEYKCFSSLDTSFFCWKSELPIWIRLWEKPYAHDPTRRFWCWIGPWRDWFFQCLISKTNEFGKNHAYWLKMNFFFDQCWEHPRYIYKKLTYEKIRYLLESEFKIRELGKPKYILGVRVTWSRIQLYSVQDIELKKLWKYCLFTQ